LSFPTSESRQARLPEKGGPGGIFKWSFLQNSLICNLQAAGIGAKESEAITNAIKEAILEDGIK